MPRLTTIIAALAIGLVSFACPQTPPPVDPGSPTATTGDSPIDCLKDVGQDAVSDAIARVNTTIASGISSGSVEAIIIRNLEGLAVDVGPKVLACAVQYVALKLKFDADHASGGASADKAAVARDYLAKHPTVFATH